jgi:hypothetical protein
MRYGLTLFLLSMLAGSLALPQSNTTSSTPTSKTPTSNTTKKPQASSTKSSPKTASSKKTVKTVASKKGKSARSATTPAVAAATWRNRQMAPTPDRYKEIQQALIDKGYLKSEANGVWDAPSQDALRQFQTDQKLSPTGKISAASLIALGLGPKPNAASVGPPPDAIETPPPAAIETPAPATAPASPPAN